MRKPSIFSREYKRRMRMRRMRIGFVIFAICVGCAAFLSRDTVSNWLDANVKTLSIKNIDMKSLMTSRDKREEVQNETKNSQETKDNQDAKNTAGADSPQVKPPEKVPETSVSEKYIEVKLKDGKTVKALYEEKGETKVLRGVDDEEIYYHMSPSGASMVLLDKTLQDIFLVRVDGSVTEIDREEYVSQNHGTFYKNQYLKQHSNYIWAATPKFIDEDRIVYISQNPYFGLEDKYLWVINLKVQPDRYERFDQIDSVKGVTIRLDRLTENGLAFEVDGKKLLLDENLKVQTIQ